MRRLALLLLVLCISACSTGKDLPMVKDSDPTWQLVPDHIDAAEMPR